MKIHHVAVAVSDLDKERNYFVSLGGQLTSPVFEDEAQRAAVQFIDLGGQLIELVAPLSDDSPVMGSVKARRRLYHMCYEVDDIEGILAEWRRKGAIVVSPPTPAVAFERRRVAFVMTAQRDLFEFLEEK